RRQEAIDCYEQVLSRFGDAKEVSLREQVAMALNSIGFDLLLESKRAWSDEDLRTRGLVAAEARFSRAREQDPNDYFVLGNLAYVNFLSGRRELVSEMLQRAFELGGEELYKETIKDSEKNTVPEDAEFRVLVEKVWAEMQAQKS
ncbi:hypothetical protein ATI61_1231, partial [Archangium gephyra]